MEVEGTDGKDGPAMRALTRNLVETIRPITNALAPAAATVAEEPGLFADAPVVVGRGGQGDYAWEMLARKGSGQDYWIETRRQNGALYMGELFTEQDDKNVAWINCAPSKERVTAMLISGLGSEAVAKVVLEVKGKPPVEVPTFRKKGFPFTFWGGRPPPGGGAAGVLHQLRHRRPADRQGDLLRRLRGLQPLSRARWPNRAWST